MPHEACQHLHALAISTGVEKFAGPKLISASVPGKGAGGESGQVHFDPLHENPRASLLLANDTLYLTWASSCDVDPYHGWVMAYDPQTLAQKAVLNTTPDGDQGGIWASDTGPGADAARQYLLADRQWHIRCLVRRPGLWRLGPKVDASRLFDCGT
jgi:hypothetical protein